MTELTQEQKDTIRAANRERKRLQRTREKEKRLRAIAEQKAVTERAERIRRNLVFFGEVSSGHNARTLDAELGVHREFLRALGKEDVQNGESLRSVAKRTFDGWVTGPFSSRGRDGTLYVPGFNRTTRRFDPHFGYVIADAPFDELWTPPKDCTGDESIDAENLPKLPRAQKPETKVEVKEPTALPPPSPPTPIPQQQPNAVHFAWVPPQARSFLN
jgi:hypothetical protein